MNLDPHHIWVSHFVKWSSRRDLIFSRRKDYNFDPPLIRVIVQCTLPPITICCEGRQILYHSISRKTSIDKVHCTIRDPDTSGCVRKSLMWDQEPEFCPFIQTDQSCPYRPRLGERYWQVSKLRDGRGVTNHGWSDGKEYHFKKVNNDINCDIIKSV